ncbi:hypothetical protein B1756_15985 [Natrarchaeobaculum aegyptiacum]|uniref:Ubiquinone biosynthesis protein UbiA n=1 Tax=Natrarchaeobaculum aegyptiacum TaxID=745377 RepID=A0A2Z2HX94_9EURY|nr:hypothetical protein B1756_15985 [Natrarchaeobaculum aegyptiacum]
MIGRPVRWRWRRRIDGLWRHVQPVFFLPGVAVSIVGAVLAPDPSISTAAVHATAVALAVYVAHLTDGYVDYYVRGEDERNRLSPAELRAATILTATAFGPCLVALGFTSGALAVGVTAPLLALGYLHAPYLDTNPITTTVDYPTGIALAVVGGYATQTGTVSGAVGTTALALFVFLSGIGILMDLLDYEHDREIGKRTVPVVLGPERARSVSSWLVVSSSVVVLSASAMSVVPVTATVIGPVPSVTVFAWTRSDWAVEVAVRRRIATTYVFTALLVLAVLLESGW